MGFQIMREGRGFEVLIGTVSEQAGDGREQREVWHLRKGEGVRDGLLCGRIGMWC